ncbi:MAG: CinA family nicotinamide mononucleotide deamidase-related protein [Flavobacteriales bacterium]
MKADIITIGDEILIGQTVDTNSAWIGHFLEDNGIHVNQIISISDSAKHIINTLQLSLENVDCVFITGGLGPTKDDITKITLAEFFEDELVLDKTVLSTIESYFAERGREVNDYTKLQALIPTKCEVIHNKKGTAPGMWFEEKGKIVVSMPGVPHEMKEMMYSVIAKIKKNRELLEIVHKTIYTRGIIESKLAELIAEWEDQLPKEIKLAYLPSISTLMLRLTARGKDKDYLHQLINSNIEKLKIYLGSFYSPIQKRLSEEVVGELMKIHGTTIATAESCTGGNIAKMLTSVDGSSAYFKGSLVAYTNDVKESMLNIDISTINKYGVVSEEVAIKMAQSAKKLFNTDYAIATTGLASKNDILDVKGGTVCFAVATPKEIISNTIIFNTSRNENIQRASNKALNLLVSIFS